MVSVKDKRGLASLQIVFFVFIVAFFVLYLGAQTFAVSKVRTIISPIDFNIGNVSFNESYGTFIEPSLKAIINTADNSGLLLIFGMIFVMLLLGFYFRANRLWVVFDFFVVVFSFIASVYMSRTFNTFINSNTELLSVYSTELQHSSFIILNLPYIVVIVGALIMIVTYGITSKLREGFR